MNKVTMTGRLTKDPVIRWTTGEKAMAIANFGIAVPRKIKRQDGTEADFFSCTAFGKTAEFIEKYWKKGMKGLFSGRIENESWTDKDGNKQQATKIMVEELEFCEKKEAAPEKAADFTPAGDEDLPFNF